MAEDLLSLTDTLDMLGVTGDADAMIVQTYIAAASEKIAAMCGPIVKTDLLTEYHDGGCQIIAVDLVPIFAVVQVREWSGGAWQTLTVDESPASTPDVFSHDRTGRLTRTGGLTFVSGVHAVEVQYRAGRVDTTDPVPEHFRQAAYMIVDRLWRLYQATGTSTYGTDQWVPARAVPPMVDELLGHELLPPGVA